MYQVGTTGSLPTVANAGTTPISILNGFPVNSANDGKNSSGTIQTVYPFGLWFANADPLYAADKGDRTAADAAGGTGGL